MDMFHEGGITLRDEGGEIEETSGNEVPLGGVKEGVADDQEANLSAGEIVIPQDVAGWHGAKFFMDLRDEAKMGYKKMEAMGQLGNADEATIPTDAMFNSGGMPFSIVDLEYIDMNDDDVDESETASMGDDDKPIDAQMGAFVPFEQSFNSLATELSNVNKKPIDAQTGALVPIQQPPASVSSINPTTGLPEVSAAPTASLPQVLQPGTIAPITTPSSFTPTTLSSLTPSTTPISSPDRSVTQQPTNLQGGLPPIQQYLGGTTGTNYFRNDAGQTIQIPIINGRQIYPTPPGFTAYDPFDPTLPDVDPIYGFPDPDGGLRTTQPRRQQSSDDGGLLDTALSAAGTYSTINTLTGGALNTGVINILREIPGGETLIEAGEAIQGGLDTLGNAIVDGVNNFFGEGAQAAQQAVTPVTEGATPVIEAAQQAVTPVTEGATPVIEAAQTLPRLQLEVADQAAAPLSTATPPVPPALPPSTTFSDPTTLMSQTGVQPTVPGAPGTFVGDFANARQAVTSGQLSSAAGLGASTPTGVSLAGAGATPTSFGALPGAFAGSLGSWLGTIAPPMAAIMALPTIAGLSRSSNRLEASMQAANAVQRSLLNPDFNEDNAARIRALTNLEGDKGQYGDVPSEGQVSSIGGALNRIQQAGGVDAIPTAGGKAMYNELLKEIEVRQLARDRMSLGVSADEQEQYARLSPEEVRRELAARQGQ